ncbi:MAG: thioredoxin domain-containing protein, partial [Campylobacterales bacterium]
EKLYSNADEIQNYLKPEERHKDATLLKPAIIKTFVKQAQHNFEDVHGGFSQQPKFPHASTLNALLDIALLQNDKEAEAMVAQTLSTMHRGGMYDLIDGGFCRYSVDEQWLVPHFEKMAYDNGLLCELYARAGRMLGDKSYTRTATEIADFMLAKMQEDGLFYSASDADSEGGEGTYFILDFDVATQALSEHGFSDEDTETILKTLHITPQGNFEGKSIVWLDAPADRPEWFGAVREIFIALRHEREYPFIDRKIQTSWNAMMIRGLFELGRSEPRYTNAAIESLNALVAFLMPKGELYHTALIHSTPKIGAFLEDYAYLGTAFVKAYEATLDEIYLMKAQQMANRALETLYDNGRWYFVRGEFTTDADPTDASYPGSVGVMVDLLLGLGILLEEKYRRFAFKTLEYYSARLAKTPIYFPYLFGQTVRYLFEDLLVKASEEKLSSAADALASVTYPYLHVKATDDGAYLLCGVQSCFAQLKNAEEIAPTIQEKFSAL